MRRQRFGEDNDDNKCEDAGNEEDKDATGTAADDDDDNNWEIGGNKENDLPEPSHRLLRGPCTWSVPALVTTAEREQNGHGARGAVERPALCRDNLYSLDAQELTTRRSERPVSLRGLTLHHHHYQ